MLALRVSRDKRGYDLIYLVWDQRRRGRPEPRLLYCCRLPAPLRVGPPPFDDEVRRRLEEAYPEIPFDWAALLKSLLGIVSATPRPVDPVPPYRDRARRPVAGPPSAVPANGHRPPPRAGAPPFGTDARSSNARSRSSAPSPGSDSFRHRPDASSPRVNGWQPRESRTEDVSDLHDDARGRETVWTGAHGEAASSREDETIVHLPFAAPRGGTREWRDGRESAAGEMSTRGDDEARKRRPGAAPGEAAIASSTAPSQAESKANGDDADDDGGDDAGGEGLTGASAGTADGADAPRRRRRRRRAGRGRDSASAGAASTSESSSSDESRAEFSSGPQADRTGGGDDSE